MNSTEHFVSVEIFFCKKQTIMNRTILIAEEVAELLRIDKQRVYELVRTHQIPVIRLGERQYRFSAQAIEQFLLDGGTRKENEDDSH